jgi:ribonuclease VapC
MIIDTSAILALLFDEPNAPWIANQLMTAVTYQMSTVNLAECLICLQDRKPAIADRLTTRLLSMNIQFIPPDSDQAQLAASARLRFPLNFGDCFAYALAKTQNLPLLTLDRDFRTTDLQLILPEP